MLPAGRRAGCTSCQWCATAASWGAKRKRANRSGSNSSGGSVIVSRHKTLRMQLAGPRGVVVATIDLSRGKVSSAKNRDAYVSLIPHRIKFAN